MIQPFSNGTEFMIWKERNCDKCVKYESKSETIEKARCRKAFYIDYSSLSGEIPLRIANKIGYDGHCLLACKGLLTERKKYIKKQETQNLFSNSLNEATNEKDI